MRPTGAEAAVARPPPAGAAVADEHGDQDGQREGGDRPRHDLGRGDQDGQPQRRHQHGALHPPAQRDGEAFGVVHGAEPIDSAPRARRPPHARPAEPDAADLDVAIVRLDPDLPLPSYAHPGDAGADLHTTVDVDARPGRAGAGADRASRSPCRTGTSRWCTRAPGSRPATACRSSTPPAPIDAGYRGEVKVLLINLDPTEPVTLRRGDRIAQLVVQRFERARFVEVGVLPESIRGARGLRFYRYRFAPLSAPARGSRRQGVLT